MKKANLGSKALMYPFPIALFGSLVKDKPNYSLVGNVGTMSLGPATLYVSSHKSHYTNIGVRENKTFSVNFPSTDLVVESDYCGIVTGHKEDKTEVFKTYYGNIKTAPLIMECPINISCNVIKEFPIGGMEVFIGRINETFVNENLISDCKRPDAISIDPILYSSDLNYYRIGEKIAQAFSIGKEYKKSKEK
ncbi:MAG: flavin reductase family protein [Candidatus Heimdallarchaeota archaeon]|nr:flavin reductase family protein [Candidatus Heimdallarchaeota archaeon]